MNTADFGYALLQGDFEQAEKILIDCIPSKLIKYIALFDEPKESKRNQKRFESLKNEELWISSIHSLNDPFEFKSAYIDWDWYDKHGFPSDLIKKFQESIDYSEEYGVTCLSDCSNMYNIPMWAYYTNNHRGFCIEYEVVRKKHIKKVFYEQNRIDVTRLLLQLYEEFKKHPHFSNQEDAMEYFATHLKEMERERQIGLLLFYSMFMKSTQWEHEKEYRVLYDEINKNISLQSVGLKTRRIIGGYGCSSGHMSILNKISNNLGCGNAYQMVLDDKTFAIHDIRI